MRAGLSSLAPLDDDDWALLTPHVSWAELSAKEPFVQPGELPRFVGFVVRGTLRIGYDRRDGRSFTKTFLREGDFVGAIDALASQAATRLRIEAITDTLLICIPVDGWLRLFDRSARWERVGRRLAEQVCLKKIQREASLLMDTPRERYRAFTRAHPQLEARIPGYMLASYLGITPETLSRFRRARVRSAS